MGFLHLILWVSLSALVFCQEGSRKLQRPGLYSPKVDLLCTNRGCISECGYDTEPFCLDESLSETSPSYILNDSVVLLRAQLVLETNISVVGLIEESFSLPASFFTSRTLEKSRVTQTGDSSLITMAKTFSELEVMDGSLSGLKVGDPYCVWQKPPEEYLSCTISTENTPLGVPTVGSFTGHFGFWCGIERFGRDGGK